MACDRVKGFLSREGHAFVDRNVEEDEAAYQDLMALGIRAVPVTVVEGEVIRGFDEARLRAALTRLGRQAPGGEPAS